MLQDIFPKHLNNRYDRNAVIEPGDYIISFFGEDVLCTSPELSFPTFSQVISPIEASSYTYIFSVDDARYFLIFNEKVELNTEQFSYIPLGSIRGQIVTPRHEQYALYTAKHLRDWYRDARFCGRCGKPMHHSDIERCMVCDCGFHNYPRIMPAVIVGVINGDRILLTKYRTGYGHNALIAGFIEIGETAEEAVAREVMEEAGIKVKNIRYYKSQPWGTANDLLVGYYCEVDGDDTIRMDEGELKYAAWVERDDIELQPDDISLTNEMMKKFKAGEL